MNKSVLLVALLGVCAVAALSENEYQLLFSKWVAQHNKKYTHDTFFYRFTVFKHNMDAIISHNKKQSSFRMGMNAMGDMTAEEFKAAKTGYNYVRRPFLRSKNAPNLKHVTASSSLDWRSPSGNTKGLAAVTPIKDQQQCGSCWAFSTTGSMEGAYAIVKGNTDPSQVTAFSEQQLVDCSSAEGNQGCNGGLMDQAFQYVMDNQGLLCQENDYPYTAADGTCGVTGGNCPDGQPEVQTGISGFQDVTSGDEGALMKAVNLGPVSVAIEADQSVFQFYSGGVLDSAACGTQLDHGVLAVGYGTDSGSGKDYWLVKNSWGQSWGEQGYVRMVRNKNMCGIAQEPSYPTLKSSKH